LRFSECADAPSVAKGNFRGTQGTTSELQKDTTKTSTKEHQRTYETMSSITYKHDQLPQSVLNLLEGGKYVHLGTATTAGVPDVALMNYYYLPSHELYSPESTETGPEVDPISKEHTYIILASGKTSLKHKNISENANVSLLLHDWTTAKNFNKQNASNEHSNLHRLLKNLNQSELSQVSATLSGLAKIVTDADELDYYKTKLLEENPDAKVYISGDENSIILVKITNAKVCDSQNHLETYH
jgi:hypothetical protein